MHTTPHAPTLTTSLDRLQAEYRQTKLELRIALLRAQIDALNTLRECMTPAPATGDAKADALAMRERNRTRLAATQALIHSRTTQREQRLARHKRPGPCATGRSSASAPPNNPPKERVPHSNSFEHAPPRAPAPPSGQDMLKHSLSIPPAEPAFPPLHRQTRVAKLRAAAGNQCPTPPEEPGARAPGTSLPLDDPGTRSSRSGLLSQRS